MHLGQLPGSSTTSRRKGWSFPQWPFSSGLIGFLQGNFGLVSN